MRVSKVVILMDSHRFAGHDAGTDAACSGEILGPVRAQVKACSAQIVQKEIVTEKIDADAFGIRQQQHVILPGDLPEQILETGACRPDHPIGLLAVRAKLGIRDDVGRITACRVHALDLDTSPPGGIHITVAASRMTVQNLRDLVDVMTFDHENFLLAP